MPKVTLTFDRELPDDETALRHALNGTAAHNVIGEMKNRIFRPARKYQSYPHPSIDAIFQKSPEYAAELIEALEGLFNEIVFDGLGGFEDCL